VKRISLTIVLLAVVLSVASPARAVPGGPAEVPQVVGQQPPAPAPEDAKPPAIEPLGGDRYKIGSVTVDRPAREVRLPGAVALREGMLEYFACAPSGKLYESLLRVDVDPYNLQVALLLIGLQPVNNLTYQGDAARPAGDPVTIEVSWRTQQGSVSHRAEDLLWQPSRKRAMEKTSWVFSGSQFVDGVFAASGTKSVIALFNDPTAILNNPLPSGADDTAYVANTEVLPPVGTEVEIVIRGAGKGGGP